MMLHQTLKGSAATAALCLFVSTANAAAINLTTPGATYNGGFYTLGFEFSVDQDYDVTSLGVYDNLGDGLATSAQVGIWSTSGGAALVSTTIGAGTSGELDGLFRYSDISPFRLNAGTSYIIGAYLDDTASSLFTGQGGSGSVNPIVNLINDRYASTSSFTFPVSTNNTGGAWLGGNFRGAVAAVPVPASLPLLATGLLGFALYGRRKARP